MNITYESCTPGEATHYYHARTGSIIAIEDLRTSPYSGDCVLPVRACPKPVDLAYIIEGEAL